VPLSKRRFSDEERAVMLKGNTKSFKKRKPRTSIYVIPLEDILEEKGLYFFTFNSLPNSGKDEEFIAGFEVFPISPSLCPDLFLFMESTTGLGMLFIYKI
jgi:hypothetical protein